MRSLKPCYFLGAGSVIHAMHHEQDIRKMGGLKKYMPITHITFLLACLAIAGIPPFSGFFSKDEILTAAFEKNPLYYYIGVAGALMTAFYMFRLYTLTFLGNFRGTQDQEHHVHERPMADDLSTDRTRNTFCCRRLDRYPGSICKRCAQPRTLSRTGI